MPLDVQRFCLGYIYLYFWSSAGLVRHLTFVIPVGCSNLASDRERRETRDNKAGRPHKDASFPSSTHPSLKKRLPLRKTRSVRPPLSTHPRPSSFVGDRSSTSSYLLFTPASSRPIDSTSILLYQIPPCLVIVTQNPLNLHKLSKL